MMKSTSRVATARHQPQRGRHHHVLLPVLLVIAVLAATAGAARIRDWDDDGGSSHWNSNSGSAWNGGSTWNGGSPTWDGGQSFQSRRDPSASGAGDGVPGPPTGPLLVKYNGGESVKNKHRSKAKGTGPQQGFSGGFLPRTSRCNNPSLPGCQTCVGDTCTACFEDLGDASFSLSEETGQCGEQQHQLQLAKEQAHTQQQCGPRPNNTAAAGHTHLPACVFAAAPMTVCPAGFGKIAEEDLPDWWAGRRRLLQTAAAEHSSSDSRAGSAATAWLNGNTTRQQQQQQDNNEVVFLYKDRSQQQEQSQGEQQEEGEEGEQQVATLGLPMPPPPWATDCLPCPINFYSPGGAVGFVECQPCPDGWTTGNASASGDCNGKQGHHQQALATKAATAAVVQCI